MMIRKYLIAGGNPTALAWDFLVADRVSLATELLREVEQVGFVDQRTLLPHLEMMGGEFCINASLAFASTLGPAGSISVSGLQQPAVFANANQSTRISIPLAWTMTGNIVLLEGIGFVLHPKSAGHIPDKGELAEFCAMFKLPAFGAVLYADETITPYVHVATMDTFVPETACGSGSVAFSLFSGKKRIRQPSGQYIAVQRCPLKQNGETGRDLFEIEAHVQPLGGLG